MMRWVLTEDDAKEAGRSLAVYAAELAPVLAPYGVEVQTAAEQAGKGGLVGGTNQTLVYDIEEAVRRVRSGGGQAIAEINQDSSLAPDTAGLNSAGKLAPG